MSHNNLTDYYDTNFSLVQHHKYSLSDIDNLMPFEKDIYISKLIDYLKSQEIEEK